MTFLKQNLFYMALTVAGALVSTFLSFAQSPTGHGKASTPDEYRQFAMTHDGDASRGKELFTDEQRLACSKCHSIDGRGSKAGPDLAAVGNQFARRDLIEAVLLPSATIAVGYSSTLVETKSGEEYQGVLKQVTDDWLELMGGDGQRVRVATSDIQERRGSSVSLMPEGLQAGLSLQEFADVIEYLVTLKQPANAMTSHRGMPETIPSLSRPLTLRPFLSEELRVPPVSGGAAGSVPLGLVWFGQVPGFAQRYLAMHQTGKIWLIEKHENGDRTSVFADFTPEVFSARGPNGLLGCWHVVRRGPGTSDEGHELFQANTQACRQGAQHPDRRFMEPAFELTHIRVGQVDDLREISLGQLGQPPLLADERPEMAKVRTPRVVTCHGPTLPGP